LAPRDLVSLAHVRTIEHSLEPDLSWTLLHSPGSPQSPSGRRWVSLQAAYRGLEQAKRWLGVADCGPKPDHVGSRNGSPVGATAKPGGAGGPGLARALLAQSRRQLCIAADRHARLRAAPGAEAITGVDRRAQICHKQIGR